MALPLMALAGGQMLLSMYQGKQAADAQNDLAEQNAENAIIADARTNRSINDRLRQEQEVAGNQKRKAIVSMIKAQSSYAARGGTTSGQSVDKLVQSINNQIGEAIDDINFNLSGAVLNAEGQRESTRAKTISRINSVPRTDFNEGLALLEGGLNIGKAYYLGGQG